VLLLFSNKYDNSCTSLESAGPQFDLYNTLSIFFTD